MENRTPSESETQTGFVPPRHWIGQEELNAGYWADPATVAQRGQEFYEKPVEGIDLIDRVDTQGVARRDFLTIMGASMAMASFSCARRPVHKIIPYVVKPEEITPGIPNWYASTDPLTGYGLLIKTREGRPIKLEGNPDHPVNRGSLNARGHAQLLNLYDPDRLRDPLMGVRTAGARKTATWAEADAEIQARLKKASTGASRVRVLTGPVRSPATRRLINEFLTGFGAGGHVEFDLLALDEVMDAQRDCYGAPVMPRFRLDHANLVVSLGSDFLGGSDFSLEYASDWVKSRKLKDKDAAHAQMSKLVAFESLMTLTGSNADERHSVRPGDELKIALALAHEIIVVRKESRFAGDAAIGSALEGYRKEVVATDTGVDAKVISKLAAQLLAARGRSLVIAGSTQSKTGDALALQIATNLLNSALDNDGETIDGTSNPGSAAVGTFAAMEKLINEMKAATVEVLVIHRTNPAFVLPKSFGFQDALRKVGTVILIADREDETAALADFVLADHHFLENWGDVHARKNVYSLVQPAIAPIHNTRAFEDNLLTWIKGAGLRSGSLATKISGAEAGENTWHDYLKATWRETLHRGGGTFEQFWENTLRSGVLLTGPTDERGAARSFRTGAVTKFPRFKPALEGTHLALYASSALGDGTDANNPWLQELPDPISTVTWDNFASISPVLAAELQLNQNDMVEVSAGDMQVTLPVYIQPGLHPKAVGVALGYGRRSVGKVGDGVGIDMAAFIRAERGFLVFSGQKVTLRKTGRFYRLAYTQWHHASENRPIINDITLAQYKANPGLSNHTDPHLRMENPPTMWPVHEYKGHRWGMTIDLNSCIGCGACSIACQAENNIPTVGRENVRKGREMHWIRIDRYYSGNVENPDVIFQPMLCQHCENAPCETVCPVIATSHSDEGLNEQIYNRCVGTRYCQNNCPYKVRRFNFFDHWKSYRDTMNLAWNPDVTVRTRGIMEKCTFCVQRIRTAKDHAKDEGRKVKDGEIKTACQQTCPTEAIVFGDMNDPRSRVSELRAEQRAFRVIEVLNTKPSISYMTKVRNKETTGEHHGSH